MDLTTQQEWDSQDFKGFRLSSADIKNKNFEECRFVDCEFVDCNFYATSFSSCSFEGCNISNSAVNECKMDEVAFMDCKIVGLKFSLCKKLLFTIKFHKCNVLMCDFSALNLSGLSLAESTFQDCDFYNTKLASTNFYQSDLSGSLFENCDLSGADFTKAINYSIDPAQNNIKKARFSMPEVLSFLTPLDIVIE